MDEIAWDNSLSVGIDLIDEQHKMLIQKLNDLSCSIDQDQGAPKVMKTLNFLIEYTEFHFSTEEKNMARFKYPGLANHEQKHGEFRKVLKDLLEDFDEEGGSEALAKAIDTFLIDWLKKHIHGTDVEFGRFLKENKLVMTE